MPESRWEPGAVVDGYKIIRRLARGGMAELFLATTTDAPTTQVAIKRVHAHLRSDPGFDAMFVRETRIAASLDHPNIVRVLGTGTLGDELYLVMELLQGLDARALLRRLSQRNTPMSYGDAIRVVIGAAHGLAYAHDREDADGKRLGIVHRDVSPSNLFVTESGEVKLVDFGIAKTTNATQITGVGVRKGKGAYMAPEQCMAGVVDRRTDVFALGAVLYELTTMTRAYDGDNELAVLHAITSRDVEPPSARVDGYPEALEAVILTALQRDADLRWSDATEMADALSELGLRPPFASSPASLAALVRGLGGASSETAPGPSTLDLTPPPFGVGDRSDGALLLPTPTSMEEIVREDTAQVTATAGEPDPDYTQPPARGLPHPSRRQAAATAATSSTTPATPATPAIVVVHPTVTGSAGDAVRVGASVVPAAMTQVAASSPATPATPQTRDAAAPMTAAASVSAAPIVVSSAPSSAVPVPVPLATTPSPGPRASDSVQPKEAHGSSLPMGWIAAGLVVILGGGLALWTRREPDQRAPASASAPADAEPTSVPPPVDTPTTPTTSPTRTPAADLPALLTRLNDPLRAGGMGFHERHTAVRDLSAGGLGDQLNIPLQLYFDLAQATQADRPCGTFRSALIALNAAHDETLLGRARTGVAVPTAPGPDEAATACDALPALLAGGAVEPPVAEPRRNGRAGKHKSKPRPPRDTAPPPRDGDDSTKPKPKPKPKHDVASKLGDDILRPFGKR